MGGLSGMLGLAGGVNGTGISGPKSANVLNPTTIAQTQTAYTGNQSALDQQQQFLQAVQAQNGLQNQSSVYNQMQGVANGTGPNPAQAQLAQATGANVANQAALMAGQRGSNANVGLMARQAAQQGANTQQQSAGQAATLQAQQSLGALQNMGSMANTQAGQQAAATSANTQAQQNEQSNLLNSVAQQNNANVGMQSNVNSANAGLAQAGMQQQGNMMGNLLGSAGSVMSMLAAGGQVPKMADGGNVQQGTYGKIDYSMPSVFDPSTNIVNPGQAPAGPEAISPAPASPSLPPTAPSEQPVASATGAGPRSSVGQFLHSVSAPSAKNIQPNVSSIGSQNYFQSGQAGKDFGAGLLNLFSPSKGSTTNPTDEQVMQDRMSANAALGIHPNEIGPPTAQEAKTGIDQELPANAGDLSGSMAAQGGRVPALVSPGEQYLKPKDVKKVLKGKNPLAVGERIPGKPKHPGNNYANDTVPKKLETGGIVIPNSIMQSKNPHFEAMKFVHATIAKNRKGLK